MKQILQPPALDIDLEIAKIRDKTATSAKLRPNQILERRIVWNFLHHMNEHGWRVLSVWDGEEETVFTDPTTPDLEKKVMELVFNLDQVALYFTQDGNRKNAHKVYFVLGEGESILTDWSYSSYSNDDADGFNKVVDEFSNNMESYY